MQARACVEKSARRGDEAAKKARSHSGGGCQVGILAAAHSVLDSPCAAGGRVG